MSKIRKALISLALAAAVSGALGACATTVTTGAGAALPLRSPQFAAYVERVFRLQNAVLDTLTYVLDEAPDNAPALAREDEVFTACAGLNDIAVRRRDGGGTRPLRDAATAKRVPACEAAALQAAEWLESAGHAVER